MAMIASSFRQSVPSAGDASSVEPPKPRQANGKKPRASLSLTVLHWRNLARSFKRAEMSLNLPKEKSPPGEDEGPPLLRAAGCDGIPESLARFASAESIAQLCACCSALRERFAAPALWRELLHRRWEGTALGEADCVRREYARRDVCERWGLSPPPVPTVQLSSRAAHADISTKLLALSVNDAATRETFSPVGRGLVDKENHTPNTQFIRAPTLRRIGRALSSPETTSSSQKSSSGTRLKQDLFQLMTGQEKRVSAFPDTPGDLTAWSGKISCASDGSVHGGRTFQIKVRRRGRWCHPSRTRTHPSRAATAARDGSHPSQARFAAATETPHPTLPPRSCIMTSPTLGRIRCRS